MLWTSLRKPGRALTCDLPLDGKPLRGKWGYKERISSSRLSIAKYEMCFPCVLCYGFHCVTRTIRVGTSFALWGPGFRCAAKQKQCVYQFAYKLQGSQVPAGR